MDESQPHATGAAYQPLHDSEEGSAAAAASAATAGEMKSRSSASSASPHDVELLERARRLSAAAAPSTVPFMSPSPPVPPELLPYTYQRDRRPPPQQPQQQQPPEPTQRETTPDASLAQCNDADEEDEDSTVPPRVPSAHPDDDACVVPPVDLLAPPLPPYQMASLYELTVQDYATHLMDCLRVRVSAVLLFLVAVLSCVYFSRGDWRVVLGAVYLMLASGVGIRATMRGEHQLIKHYYRALLVWLSLFVFAFVIWMTVDGVESSVQARCAVASFASSYGTACTQSTQQMQDCVTRCVWEMRINLSIEAIALAAAVGVLIFFLMWDASRLSSAMSLWAYHPLRARWHSDLNLANRYADVRRRRPRADELDLAATEKEEEHEAAATQSQTYGSGIVGIDSSTTTARRRNQQGSLVQLRREQQQHQGATNATAAATAQQAL